MLDRWTRADELADVCKLKWKVQASCPRSLLPGEGSSKTILVSLQESTNAETPFKRTCSRFVHSPKNFAASGAPSRVGARQTTDHLRLLEPNDPCWVSCVRGRQVAMAWNLAAVEAA